jgi:thiamine-monophosphate kinase
VAGCDSSDGLAAAVGAIATASGCGALLERHLLPLDELMAKLPFAQAWGLGGGEDFELVLALKPAWAMGLVEGLPGASRIGELVPATPGLVRWSPGGAPLGPSAIGYTHFH